MYVFMYVCMYVCIYVCVYVCMYVCAGRRGALSSSMDGYQTARAEEVVANCEIPESLPGRPSEPSPRGTPPSRPRRTYSLFAAAEQPELIVLYIGR